MTYLRRIISGLAVTICVLHAWLAGAAEGGFPAKAEEYEIVLHLRHNLPKALEDPKENDALIVLIEEKYPGDPADYPAVIKAYYGSLIGLRAKHAFFPNRKLKYLTESLSLMDEAVVQDDAGLETFFLRFSSLHHMPPLLSIPTKRREDIARIIKLVKDESFMDYEPDFQKDVVDFMLESRRLTEEQMAELERVKKQMLAPSLPEG